MPIYYLPIAFMSGFVSLAEIESHSDTVLVVQLLYQNELVGGGGLKGGGV